MATCRPLKAIEKRDSLKSLRPAGYETIHRSDRTDLPRAKLFDSVNRQSNTLGRLEAAEYPGRNREIQRLIIP